MGTQYVKCFKIKALQMPGTSICMSSLTGQMFPALFSFLGDRFPLLIVFSYPPQEHGVSFFHLSCFLISCALRTCPHNMILMSEPGWTVLCPLDAANNIHVSLCLSVISAFRAFLPLWYKVSAAVAGISLGSISLGKFYVALHCMCLATWMEQM